MCLLYLKATGIFFIVLEAKSGASMEWSEERDNMGAKLHSVFGLHSLHQRFILGKLHFRRHLHSGRREQHERKFSSPKIFIYFSFKINKQSIR